MQLAQGVAILIIMLPLFMATKQIPKAKTRYLPIMIPTHNMVSLTQELYRNLTSLICSVKIRI
jgi:hypothetical protein